MKTRFWMILVGMLLIGVAVFLGRMPVLAAKYNEAPMLRTMMTAGELPPVEQRLPDEPLVVEPGGEEIGVYGGSMIITFWPTSFLFYENPINAEVPEYLKPIPNVIEMWEVNEDATKVIFFLRKGMKWSDGYPFTADDWMFWYKDMELNKELTPIQGTWYKIGGEHGVLTKIDDYTIKWTFVSSYGSFIDSLSMHPMRLARQFAPAHYLKQFHADYATAEELEKTMKAEGFDTWMDLFGTRMDSLNNPELPVLSPWIVKNPRYSEIQIWERNPYYWKVDPEGNQLPYIDRIECPRSAGPEADLLKLIAGEIDFADIHCIGGIGNFPIAMENREKGDYRMVGKAMGKGHSHRGVMYLNVHHKNLAKRELFNNLDFRKALSVAINREEMIDVVRKGMGLVTQVAPASGPPYHGEDPKFKEYYTQYDPELANQLLDKIGLTEYDDKGYRLGLDSKKLLILLQVTSDWVPEFPAFADMYKEYFAAVGLNSIVKPAPDTALAELVSALEHDILVRYFAGGNILLSPANGYLFPQSGGWHTAPLWARWILTDGKLGEEPPDWVKRLAEIEDEAKAEVDTKKRIALYNEAVLLHVDELMPIGGIGAAGFAPQKFMFSNRVRNMAEPMDLHMISSQVSSWYILEESR